MYDLIIIGAGPAGLTASIYASCFHLKYLVIGKLLGGQMQYAPEILNYPGFERISGKELTERMVVQVKKRGGELVTQSVTRIIQLSNQQINQSINNSISNQQLAINNKYFEVETEEGQKYQAKAIILATGTERRKLNVPGEVKYTGRGVNYCATCEKLDYASKVCGVIGGANAAVQGAVQLAQAASKVYIIYRGSELRGDPIWLEQVEKNPKIEVIYNTVVSEIMGDGEKVTGVKIKSNNPITQLSNNPINNKQATKTPRGWQADPPAGGEAMTPPMVEESRRLPLDKLFVEIGGVPGTALVIPLGVEMDPGGYIKVNSRMATNVAGIFAAGDLVSYGLSIEQISSAIGLGARAAASVFSYIKQEKTPMVWGRSQIKR